MYVEDILLMGSDTRQMYRVKNELCSLLSMTDLGLVEYFLGVRFKDMESSMRLTWGEYIEKVLVRLNISICSNVHTPMFDRIRVVSPRR